MLTVTEAAVIQIEQVFDNSQVPKDSAIRLDRSEGGLALRIDDVRPTDRKFARDGKTVLVVDKALSEALGDSVFDVQITTDGTRLAVV